MIRVEEDRKREMIQESEYIVEYIVKRYVIYDFM